MHQRTLLISYSYCQLFRFLPCLVFLVATAAVDKDDEFNPPKDLLKQMAELRAHFGKLATAFDAAIERIGKVPASECKYSELKLREAQEESEKCAAAFEQISEKFETFLEPYTNLHDLFAIVEGENLALRKPTASGAISIDTAEAQTAESDREQLTRISKQMTDRFVTGLDAIMAKQTQLSSDLSALLNQLHAIRFEDGEPFISPIQGVKNEAFECVVAANKVGGEMDFFRGMGQARIKYFEMKADKASPFAWT